MSVIQSIQNIFGAARIRSDPTASTGRPAAATLDSTGQTDLLRAQSTLLGLYRSLDKLAELANITTRFKLDLPDARSATGLGLDLTETAASLSSSEEINASPRSFTPFGPDWDLGSTALLTIGGEYDGANGSGTISFEVRRDGIHGVDNLQIRARDPANNTIDTFNIRRDDPADQQYSLQNGLYFTLGPNALIDNDTTTIEVFDNVGAAVDPDRPLGGIRNDNPNLQFGGPSISNGSFTVNGADISVATTDSISDVIDRINQSAGGVTALFNATTERIEFLQNTYGSVPTIDLQGDTSNFLVATKLDSLNVIAGIDPESVQPFDAVAAFSAVQSGDILINGQQIAIDTATDSLSSVIDRINASPAGVVASFDVATQTVLIEATDPASSLDIDSNGTGFFSALAIPEGRVDPEALSNGISRRRSYDIADQFADVFSRLNSLFQDSSFIRGGSNAESFRNPLESGLRNSFSDGSSAARFGLHVDLSDDARLGGHLASLDRQRLTRDLQLRGDTVKHFIGGENGGLIADLIAGTVQSLKNVNALLGKSGFFVDQVV